MEILLFILALFFIAISNFGYVKNYGYPNRFIPPRNVDFYVMSNEDLGHTASLVTGTNDSITLAMPYPASWDIATESLIVYALEFYDQREHTAVLKHFGGYIAFLSMLKKDLTATFRGQAADSVDEFLKAQFARNIFFGIEKNTIAASAAAEGVQRNFDNVVDAVYVPPTPMDLKTPLYITLVGQRSTVALATNVVTDADADLFEFVTVTAWFTTRRLTTPERDAREQMQMLWQRLDS